MTVSELIEFLKTQPQDLQVAYCIFSEMALMRLKDIEVVDLCEPRNDGWVARKRPDKPTQKYLLFPGN
jgi:hypothetical protein